MADRSRMKRVTASSRTAYGRISCVLARRLTLVHVECQRAYGYAHHAFGVIEKPQRLRV
jgi:hypothetical protein